MFKGEAIECLKCKNRFLDTRQEWQEIEKKLCLYCNNSDTEKTIVLNEEQLEDCNCKECKEILTKLKKQ